MAQENLELEGTVVKQTTLVGLEAPRLKGMSMEEMIAFIRRREEYEAVVREKNNEPGVQIQLTSYRNSVDPRVLRMMYRAKWITAQSLDSITDEDIKQCISSRSTRSLDNLNAKEIDTIVKNVTMKMDTVDPTSRVWTLALDYEKALEDAGYKDLLERCPHIAIEHMVRFAQPPVLKSVLRDLIRLRRNEGIHKKDFFRFVELMVEKAEDVDRMERLQKGSKQDAGSKKRGKAVEKEDNSKGTGSQKKSEGDQKKKDKKFKYTCLLPRCDGNHRIKDCPLASPEEVKKYLNLYFEQKKLNKGKSSEKSKDAGSLNAIAKAAMAESSTLFVGKFLDGTVTYSVLADIGADDNFMPCELFTALTKADGELAVTELLPPLVFKLAMKKDTDSEPVKIPCHKKLDADVRLAIRHGTELLLRRVSWLVCDESADCAYLGSPLLERLGLNARTLLDAACSEHGGIVDARTLMEDDEGGGAESLSSMLRDGIYHGLARGSDGLSDETEMYIDLGDDPKQLLYQSLDIAVLSAMENGLSKDGAKQLEKLIKVDFKDIFRIRLGSSEPAKVRPTEMKLKPGSRPVRVKARRYSPDQREFLKKYVDKLVEMGFLKPSPHAQWQCAPLLVHKPNSKAKFRMTIDLHPINSATEKNSWPMPHIESELSDLAGSTCFAKLDFVSGYWQIPVHPNSQDYCGIVTPNGVYTSTRVLQGLTNATSHFQGTVEPLFTSIRSNLKAWLDDFMLYAKNEEELLRLLEEFFRICKVHGLYLSAKKCEFFVREVKWCGRVVSKDGYRLDPLRLSALQEWDVPKTAGELCEFIHCCRWMSINIPAFTERVEVLNEVVENAYKMSNKRTKKSIKNILLSKLSWGTTHVNAFRSIQKSLQSAVQLSHPKEGLSTCVYTDASDKCWSAVVTQVHPNQLSLSMVEQRHEPLAFLGGKFKKSEVNWSMYEKEAYAIFSVFKKLDYLKYGSRVTHIFTDHRNLLFVFCPSAVEPALGRHVFSKVQRWALYLSKFDYVIEHIPGVENVFADILTRWLKGYRVQEKGLRRVCRISHITEQLVPSPSNKDFVWPSWDMIKQAQSRHSDECTTLQKSDDGVYRKKGLVYIPKDEFELQVKLLVVSHCSTLGHRGMDATESVLCEEFYWDNVHKDVRNFVKGCVHCLITRSGSLIPRPLGSALHGKRPNEVVHLDFLYMGSSTMGFKYVLLMKDDLSGYVWMRPFTSANAEAAAKMVSEWIALFSCMAWMVSDQGSHFKNELLKDLTKEYRVSHHFVTAYSPWANGTVERVCREVLRCCRALLSEWRLGAQDWPLVIHCIQSVLNESPSKRLGLRDKSQPNVYRTPLECFTGIKPRRPLLRALPVTTSSSTYSDSYAAIERIIDIDEATVALDAIHKSVVSLTSADRKRKTDYHNAKTNVKKLNLSVGDFVLVRRPQEKGHKLRFVRTGPRRVVEVKSPMVCVVEELLSKKRDTVHSRRLVLYRADMDGKEVSEALNAHADHTETVYDTVCDIHDIRADGGNIEVQIEWDGFPDTSDWTWESLKNVSEDVPDILTRYLATPRQKSLKKQALSMCSTN